MPEDPSPEQHLLAQADTIAVIGLSTDPKKDSRIVAGHMRRRGYRVIPVHPKADEILGETAYPSLADLPEDLAAEVDVVNVFRPADEVPGILDEALTHLPNLQGLWTQKGIVHDQAAARAREAGLIVVQDRCIRTQDLYARFAGDPSTQEATTHA